MTAPVTPERTVPLPEPSASAPLVIAHRGASAYRPEHTLASYRLAVGLGADYVEPDLVLTRDGVLVARHENNISATTDVADRPEFRGRRTRKVIGGRVVDGWFVEDFTLAELKRLRAREPRPEMRPGSASYDDVFEIPTFDEILELVAAEGRRRGEVVGVCPELKQPAYFRRRGLFAGTALVEALERHHLNRPNARVMVQCFDAATLRRLRPRVRVSLVQLASSTTAAAHAAGGTSYADVLAVDKRLLVRSGGNGSGGRELVARAHAAGLAVLAWTFRDEEHGLPGRAVAEYVDVFDAGVDGVFTDNPDTALRARARYASGITIHATR